MPGLHAVKKELRPQNLGLRYHRRDVFYKNQWGFPPVIFLVYRVGAAVYMTTWLFLSTLVWYHNSKGHIPIVFLTFWSFIVLCCHLVLAAVIKILHIGQMGKLCTRADIPLDNNATDIETRENALPWYIKVDWIMFTVSVCAAPLVTVIYFTVLWPRKSVEKNMAVPGIEGFHIHAVNTMVTLTDLFLSAIPVRLYHCVYPVAYGFLYMSFSLVYWAVDHDNVLYRSVIDWNKPGRSAGMTILLLLVALPVMHLLMFLIVQLRVFVCRINCRGSRSRSIDTSMKTKENNPPV